MSAGESTTRASRVVWHAAADEAEWIERSADAIAQSLRHALAAGGDATLLLSGGTTPAPVYRSLTRATLDWSRVRVGLVDERDVGPDADGSNARLVCESLLHDRAAAARFEPLRDARQTAEDAMAAANARWRGDAGSPPPIVAVLGMGEDGHTASLFPGAANLDEVLVSRDPYAVVDARGCTVAGAYPTRISLTPAGLGASASRFLLIRAAAKRAVFERALAPGDVRDLPVRIAIDSAGAALQVFWCP